MMRGLPLPLMPSFEGGVFGLVLRVDELLWVLPGRERAEGRQLVVSVFSGVLERSIQRNCSQINKQTEKQTDRRTFHHKMEFSASRIL